MRSSQYLHGGYSWFGECTQAISLGFLKPPSEFNAKLSVIARAPARWRVMCSRATSSGGPTLRTLYSLGAEGVLPGRQIESLLRVCNQFAPTLPSG